MRAVLRKGCLASVLLLAACGNRPAAIESDAGSAPVVHDPFAALGALGDDATVVRRDDRLDVRVDPPRSAIRARVTLPVDATGAFEIGEDVRALRATVRLVGAHPSTAVIERGRVRYDGALGDGTALLHVPSAIGVEDFVAFERAPAVPELRYEVTLSSTVAGLRSIDGVLELLDRDGVPRLRVARPWILDRDRRRHDASLDVTGCAVDRDPRPPWGRAPTAPGASRARASGTTCFVTVRWPAEIEYPAIVDPAWTTTGSMSQTRARPLGGVLGSGRAIVHGGYVHGTAVYTSTELYDLATGTFAATAPTAVGHAGGGGLTLKDGTFLVWGGGTMTGPSPRTEVYDPTTGTWTTVVSAEGSTSHFGYTLLDDGRVLELGGDTCCGYSQSARVYDPATKSWTATTNLMTEIRWFPSVVKLTSGKVLVVTGRIAHPEPRATDLFDPATNSWTRVGDLAAYQGPSANLVALPGGGAALMGGRDLDGNLTATVQLWDPATGKWSIGPSAPSPRIFSTVAKLPSGKVLLLGSGDVDLFAPSTTVDAYDPATGAWESFFSLLTARAAPVALTFPSGSVLVVGGSGPSGPLATAELNAQLPNASTCGGNAECASGFCVDGVCCASACTASCSACDVPGTVGTCAPVASGKPRGARSCGEYAECKAGACSTTCASDAACATGHFCDALGRCKAKKPVSAPCGAANECQNGICVDGFCCASSCTSVCAACDVPGHLGACVPVYGAPHGGRTGCTGANPGTTCGTQCDGSDVTGCHYPDDAVGCGTSACTSGVERHPGRCDGKGSCDDTPKSCGAYACGTVACLSSCTTSDECALGHYCKGGACVPAEGTGVACTSGRACAEGLLCTDGVCCDKSDCGDGASCATSEKAGTCAKVRGATCATSAECASGHCVDGVCCDSSCDGQCEACAEPLQLGKCVPIAGAPRGARTSCEKGSGACDARACDGAKDRTTCAGFAADTSVVCGESLCTEKGFLPEARCNGAGKCAVPLPVPCQTYACRETGCLESCATDADCAVGSRCAGGKCVLGATCTADKLGSIPKEGGPATSCAPYTCNTDGVCRTQCATSDDCQGGAVCDSSQRCVVAGAAESEGGCSGTGRTGAPPIQTLMITGLIIGFCIARPGRAARTRGTR